MSLISFVLKSYWLAFSVFARSVVIVAVVVAAVVSLVRMLFTTDILVGLVVMAFLHPFLAFLSFLILGVPLLVALALILILIIRTALASVRMTSGSGPMNLMYAMFRMARFNNVLATPIVIVFGVGGTIALAQGLRLYEAIQFTETTLRDPLTRSALLDATPIILLLPLNIALAMVFSVLGVSYAATAANAAERSPNHDLLWGMCSSAIPILVVALIGLPGPVLALAMMSGGPLAGVQAVAEAETWGPIAGAAALWVWGLFACFAAIAIGYGRAHQRLEFIRQARAAAYAGPAVSTEELRNLRRARTIER